MSGASGLVRKILDHPKEADDALRKAIEANPRFSKSYVALGYLYLDYDFNKKTARSFQGCVTAKDDDGECHNGYGLALKNLQAVTSKATAGSRRPSTSTPSSTTPSTTPAWRTRDCSTGPTATTKKRKARQYLQQFVSNGGKSADGNYVKAASDKLYALSGPPKTQAEGASPLPRSPPRRSY